MTKQLQRLIITGAITIALESSVPSALGQIIHVPPAPGGLHPPDGNVVYLKGHAVGTQNYFCLPADTGFAWRFFGPQATLFVSFRWINGEIRQQIMTHFLSPNPDEAGTPRATWQSSLDTSAVWGRAVASSTDPAFVAPGAIPWLLVQIVGSEPGPSGGASLAATTYIQRLNTAGGVAPATGCSQAADVGKTALVPYTTDYYFYKSVRER